MHSAEGKAHFLYRCECSYHECNDALKVVSRIKAGLSEIQPLSRDIIPGVSQGYGDVLNYLIEVLGLTNIVLGARAEMPHY